MNQYLKLAINDFKLIFRDTSLRTFLFLPILIFVIVLWILPMVVEKYEVVTPFLLYILMVCVIELTQGFSFIYSMVLIDEKETEVAKAYGVLPVEHHRFILARFFFPTLITVLMILILLWTQPFYEVSIGGSFLVACLSGLIVPTYILGVTMQSANRLEGMIWVKGFNILVIAPVAAFFVPKGLVALFGIFPTHWIFQSLEQLFSADLGGNMSGSFLLNFGIGVVFFLLLIFGLTRRFVKVHFA